MRHITKLFYAPFDWGIDPPPNAHSLQRPAYQVKLDREFQFHEELLLDYILSPPLLKIRFDEYDTRFYAEIDGGKETIFINEGGKVRRGQSEYYLYPSNFLGIYTLLNVILVRQKRVSGQISRKPR